MWNGMSERIKRFADSVRYVRLMWGLLFCGISLLSSYHPQLIYQTNIYPLFYHFKCSPSFLHLRVRRRSNNMILKKTPMIIIKFSDVNITITSASTCEIKSIQPEFIITSTDIISAMCYCVSLSNKDFTCVIVIWWVNSSFIVMLEPLPYPPHPFNPLNPLNSVRQLVHNQLSFTHNVALIFPVTSHQTPH